VRPTLPELCELTGSEISEYSLTRGVGKATGTTYYIPTSEVLGEQLMDHLPREAASSNMDLQLAAIFPNAKT
jgi:hypothetical protein